MIHHELGSACMAVGGKGRDATGADRFDHVPSADLDLDPGERRPMSIRHRDPLSAAEALAARLTLSLPQDLADRLAWYLTPELLRGLADLAVDLGLAGPVVTGPGGGQHAVSFGDI